MNADDLFALADATTLLPKFKSKIETEFWRDGVLLLSACPALEGEVARLDYEPESFNIPGGRYTPDFRAIMDNGQIVFIETKGSRKQRGYRDARSKLRAAAALNPFYHWIEARYSAPNENWELEQL